MDADLKALEAEAVAVDAMNLPPAPDRQEPDATASAQNEVAELSALVQIVSGLFAPMFPSLREIYAAPACDALAAAAVPVMAKRGWSVSGLLGQYAEEVALLAVAAPMALATYQGVSADMAKAEKVQKEADKISRVLVAAANEPTVEPRA